MIIEENIKNLEVSIIIEREESMVLDEQKICSESIKTIFLTVRPGAQCIYTISQSKNRERKARLDEHASIIWHEHLNGDQQTSHIETELLGEESRAEIYSAIITKNADQLFVSHKIFHKAPRTTSTILCRGIAEDASILTYHSLIDMDQKSSGAKGKQRADLLIASPKAKVESIPDLGIRHHAVQCQHGVSITTLQELPLFYLASRGLSKDEATQMLLSGHIQPVLDRMYGHT